MCYQSQQLNLFLALFELNTSWPCIIYYRAFIVLSTFLRCSTFFCGFHWWLCFMNYGQVLSSAFLLLYQLALWILLLPSNFFLCREQSRKNHNHLFATFISTQSGSHFSLSPPLPFPFSSFPLPFFFFLVMIFSPYLLSYNLLMC